MTDNGWLKAYLEGISNKIDVIDHKLDSFQGRISKLEERTKLGTAVWGLLGGLIPAAAVVVYLLLGVR